MKCENCNKDHDGSYGSGRFCSSKCASSFSTSKDNKSELKDAICPKCGKKHKINKRASEKLTPCIDCGGKGSQKRNDSKYIGICIYCGGEVKKGRLFCNNYKCQLDYQYLIYINKWKLGLVDGIKSKRNASNHVRRYLFEKYDNKCQKCGWGMKNRITNKIPLEVHHKDGDHTNGKEENLNLLCPNCHSLTDNFGILNSDDYKNQL